MAANVLFNKPDKDRRPCVDGNVSLTNAYVPYDMMDWPAGSYSLANHTMVTCGETHRARAMEQIPAASQVAGAFGGLGVSQLGVSDGSPPTSSSGNSAALDVTTGKLLAFHQHWPAICYSGSINTASGLTLVGHFDSGNGADGQG